MRGALVTLTIAGFMCQTIPVVWGVLLFQRQRAEAARTNAARHGPEEGRPPSSSTWNDVKYLREFIIEQIIEHGWRGLLWSVVVILFGGLLLAVAGVWSLYLSPG